MKVKVYLVASLCLFVGLTACNFKSTKSESSDSPAMADLTADSLELERGIRAFYEWNEEMNSKADFVPIQANEGDEKYGGLDMERHQIRLKELEEVDLFTEEFLTNYNQLAISINERLKDGRLEWYVGELPPFGNGADPWCNCQDTPDGYWWNLLTIKDLRFDGTVASYAWTWGDGFEYKVQSEKTNKGWRILSLEGFNFSD